GRLAVEVLLEVEHACRLGDLAVDLGAVDARELEREAHVLAHGHVRVKRVVLEDHRDVAILGRALVDDLAADLQIALGDVLEAGAIDPVGCWNCDAPGNCEIAAGTVCACGVEVSETAKTKSFQAKMKTRIAVVKTPGAASGAMTLVKAWNGVAPSTAAACSRSQGISLKNADSV